MRRSRLVGLRTAIAGMALLGALQAQAALYNFTYTDGINAAQGNLSTTMIGGYEVATSGGMLVTAGAAAGSFFLLGNPNAPGIIISPSQKFQYDNIIKPTATPHLTTGGLLFTDGSREVNIWGNSGANDYSFWGWGFGSGYNPASDNGTFKLEAVPEPFTIALGAAGLALAVARKRRSRKA